jgi:hypothetical protein
MATYKKKKKKLNLRVESPQVYLSNKTIRTLTLRTVLR